MVRTSSSTADFATRSECAERIPLTPPYAMPRSSLILGVLLFRGRQILMAFALPVTATTRIVWHIIQMINCRRPSRSKSWSRLCAGSPIAPNVAIRMAPAHTSTVPLNDHLVKDSPSMRVAQIELKTRPDYT